LTGAEAEGGDIPAGVPMERLTPEAPEAAEGAPEPMEEVVEETAGGEAVTTSPEIALEVAICHTRLSEENQVQTYMHARIKFHAYSDIKVNTETISRKKKKDLSEIYA
jgi:hypothetical protein